MSAPRPTPAGLHRESRGIADERGIALLAVLGITLALLPLAAAIAVETRLDVLMQRNVRSGTEAFYVAEAGLAHALAELGPVVSVRILLNGPDGIASTLDDGVFPFALAAPAEFVPPPGGYEVFVEPGPGSSIRLLSRGRAAHAALREVEMLVAPAVDPFTPGALYIGAEDVEIDLGSQGFAISGAPQLEDDSGAIAGIAVPSAQTAVMLRASVEPAASVSGAGGSASIVTSPQLDLATYSDLLASRTDAAFRSAPEPGAALALGTESAPQLTIGDNNWTVAGAVSGWGILLLRGDLEITGQLQYRGLVVVEGEVDLANSGNFQMEGALWTSGPSAGTLRLRGAGFVHYEPAVLRQVDAAIPEALLRLPVVVAWHEVS